MGIKYMEYGGLGLFINFTIFTYSVLQIRLEECMLCLARLGTPRRQRWWSLGSRSWGCGRRSSCTTGPPSPRPTPTSPPPPPGPSSPSPARRPTGPSIRAKPLLMANVMLYQNILRGTYKFRKYIHCILSLREFQTLLIFSKCFFSKLQTTF